MAAMTNADLQAIITEYGSRLCAIQIDNIRNIYVGYKDGPKLSDIELKTIGGCDMILVKNHVGPNGVKHTSMFVTECVQGVVVSDEPYGYVDPLILK